MNETRRKCLECGEETYAIQVIDRGQKNIHYHLMALALASVCFSPLR